MEIVHTLVQIETNIQKMEQDKKASIGALTDYKDLIKRGTCFLPYQTKEGLSFAPSRFIGYIDNELVNHRNNTSRDGRITNEAINHILGSRPTANLILEQAYCDFCKSIGINPSAKGSFGAPRRYWVTPEISILIENKIENEIHQNIELKDTDKLQITKARFGQGIFRDSLIELWGKCCISKCDYLGILKASHIKPWRDSTNEERLDKFNGLLLLPNFDALFDRGLISFTDNGNLLTSKSLTDDTYRALGIDYHTRIPLKKEHAKYLKWHRENIFIDKIIS